MELRDIRTRNDAVWQSLRPYLVATPFNLPFLHRKPFGLNIADEDIICPLRVASAPFLALLERLDALTFGPEGMPMPRWVFYDCSELPGAIFGFGLPASEVDEHVRAVFKLPIGYSGLVPFSMYIAIPMAKPGSWFGHNLCSIAPSLPAAPLSGLGSITKAVALRCFGVKEFYGATQWDSKALFIHAKFGPLDLMTTYTPAHSELETLTYHFRVTDEGLRSALGDPTAQIARPAPDEFLTSRDVPRMIELQDALQRGERYQVPRAPVMEDGGVLKVPVTRIG